MQSLTPSDRLQGIGATVWMRDARLAMLPPRWSGAANAGNLPPAFRHTSSHRLHQPVRIERSS
ncbi:hypothetical protein BRAO285_1280020 [Bradyrhizobium sp. ORS 285]|nr:hypothetical protein BRAO285_1280020 [Bradyrhizobium sp. ORS 285]